MVEYQDECETAGLAIDVMKEHGAGAINHIIGLIIAAVRRGDDDAVLRLDRALRYIEARR